MVLSGASDCPRLLSGLCMVCRTFITAWDIQIIHYLRDRVYHVYTSTWPQSTNGFIWQNDCPLLLCIAILLSHIYPSFYDLPILMVTHLLISYIADKLYTYSHVSILVTRQLLTNSDRLRLPSWIKLAVSCYKVATYASLNS